MGASVVLDVGKTNTKLCAVDASGRVLVELRRPSAVLAGPPYPRLDCEGVFDWAIEGLARIAADHAVAAIVPVAHGATAALVSGEALVLPVLDYEFEGVAEFDAAYEPLARDFARTRSPRLPAGLNLGRQLFWLERRFPAEFARTSDILLWPQYFAWRLSGARASEWTSLGCHTDLWQPEARAFSSLARERGWDTRFPPLVPAWRRLGAIRPELARATGLRADCAVLAGIHDSNASYLVHRARREDAFAVVSTGTWFVCMAHGAALERLNPELDMLANVDAFGDPVATARLMGGRRYETLIERATPRAVAALELARDTDRCLDALGATGDVIVEGPFARDRAYCEALAGLRKPQPVFASADATGTIAGALRLVSWPDAPPMNEKRGSLR
ncbi:MAG: FGGY family carbohydrate kinase [Myxococcota bacterium]